jgi:uncharacterized membrane protein YeaQ/YmgE (transglycosylase-associated protein family)
MIDFIVWIVIGAIVGWIASMIMKTNAQQGWLMNIIVGIVGALLGGWLFGLFGIGGADATENPFSLISWIASIVGAVILLAIVGFFTRGRAA